MGVFNNQTNKMSYFESFLFKTEQQGQPKAPAAQLASPNKTSTSPSNKPSSYCTTTSCLSHLPVKETPQYMVPTPRTQS